jgi:hypothetical protein
LFNASFFHVWFEFFFLHIDKLFFLIAHVPEKTCSETLLLSKANSTFLSFQTKQWAKKKNFFRSFDIKFVQKQNLWKFFSAATYPKGVVFWGKRPQVVKREFRKTCKISKFITNFIDGCKIHVWLIKLKLGTVNNGKVFKRTISLVCCLKTHKRRSVFVNENNTMKTKREFWNVILNFVCEFWNFTCFSNSRFTRFFW